ncbi:high affinity immunoglobulin epsilon receptor subunit alpha-like [Parambassis ranga]|uniref:high affinity immunoglobulin epsilon receptor subunit alpha-like n=1 Tax=Parambassis ranga TaxID=210632 RepID=UPI001041F89B|nr:high affinity immunoglobulin epsilon receptor subunit alpha-like [Parambassis ranga]
METILSLLVLSSLPQLVVLQRAIIEDEMPRAQIELLSQNSRIFSNERLRMRCSIPDDRWSTLRYKWFRDFQQLSYFGEELSLWNAKLNDSGKYQCRGVADTQLGDLDSVLSLPVEITVDGGWAVLQVSPQPGLVGDTLNMTCRIRGSPPVHEMILYKDGVEVMKQNGPAPFSLSNMTLEDQGMYSCRVSWNLKRQTQSVISSPIPVQILEILPEPVLEIFSDNNLAKINKMKLICHVQYNARAPAPPIIFYFYRNNSRLGTATSQNSDLVSRNPGLYSCKAKVPDLHLTRWSNTRNHG